MNKKLLILLAIAIVVIVPAASACGRTGPTGITKLPAPRIPHAINDVRFENCLACHANDQIIGKTPINHVDRNSTNQNCISIACHRLPS